MNGRKIIERKLINLNVECMMRRLANIMVTGGSGFIGSNFIKYIFTKSNFKGRIINVDKLTYAGNHENLFDIESIHGGNRYFFEKNDVCNYTEIKKLFNNYTIDTVVHFAAESHVDRSIFGPKDFIDTNILGTFNLLEVARECWPNRDDVLFHHVSTDEVYGSLGETGYFFETTPYDPRSPYAASKASSDHLVMAYHHTYNIPVTISNCSNNYGPYQFPEKLIPLIIQNIKNQKSLPVYGDGKNIRDWLFVDDHNNALWLIINNGLAGNTYNIGGDNEWENIRLVNVICEKMAHYMGKEKDYFKKLITFVRDRPGHDRRYAINCIKIKQELGWHQNTDFNEGLDKTIRWYLDNEEWVKRIISGEYRSWIEKKLQ